MLKIIIKKEILESIFTAKFVVTFIICSILILLSVFTGLSTYKDDIKEYNEAVAFNEKNLQLSPNYQALATSGIKLNKKPEILSILSTGIENNIGRVVQVNLANDPDSVKSKYSTDPIQSVFGQLDFTFIVLTILSLFAILFTYDAVSGERQDGTLKLSISYPVTLYKLIFGKIIGRYFVLIITLSVPIVLSLIIIIIYPDIYLNSDDWLRIIMIFVSYLLYLSVFFSLGLFISTITKQSSSSLLLLLFIWILIVMVIPKSSILIAKKFKPTKSSHEITALKDGYLQEIQAEAPRLVRKWMNENRNLKTIDSELYNKEFQVYAENLQKELTHDIEKKNSEIESSYQLEKSAQMKLAIQLTRISPASLLTFSCMRLAKTGINENQRYINSVKSYKPYFSEWINDKILVKNIDDLITSNLDVDTMPRHQFTPEDFKTSLNAVLVNLALMLFYFILFFIATFVSFIKYDFS